MSFADVPRPTAGPGYDALPARRAGPRRFPPARCPGVGGACRHELVRAAPGAASSSTRPRRLRSRGGSVGPSIAPAAATRLAYFRAVSPGPVGLCRRWRPCLSSWLARIEFRFAGPSTLVRCRRRRRHSVRPGRPVVVAPTPRLARRPESGLVVNEILQALVDGLTTRDVRAQQTLPCCGGRLRRLHRQPCAAGNRLNATSPPSPPPSSLPEKEPT